MIQELDRIVLTDDLSDYNLKSGDVGTVVLIHGENKGYEVEFVALTGETIAVVSLLPSQLRHIQRGEIAHVRMVEA
jgi:Domain of unknown function (DUF4926)